MFIYNIHNHLQFMNANMSTIFKNIASELNKVKNELTKTLNELAKVKKELALHKNISKGRNCSKNGLKYEKQVHGIVSKCHSIASGIKFNSQEEKELGGSGANNDIVCKWMVGDKITNIPIEIKKKNTPDWMQFSIHYDKENKKWSRKENTRSKIPKKSVKLFKKLLKNFQKEIFNGKIPPFIEKTITHDEWKNIKSNTSDFNDMYFDCPDNTIKKLYSAKGCKYIQISEKGLYHLGNDVCDFGVPKFICPQQLRLRTKIHTRKNKKGFCQLSVILACQPKNINKLTNSMYNLDDNEKLPSSLRTNSLKHNK